MNYLYHSPDAPPPPKPPPPPLNRSSPPPPLILGRFDPLISGPTPEFPTNVAIKATTAENSETKSNWVNIQTTIPVMAPINKPANPTPKIFLTAPPNTKATTKTMYLGMM